MSRVRPRTWPIDHGPARAGASKTNASSAATAERAFAPNMSSTKRASRNRRPGRAAEQGRITGPRPINCGGAEPRPHWVEREVANQHEKLRIALDMDGVKSPLEQVTCQTVAMVEQLRVPAAQVLTPCREVRLRRLDDEMNMVVHEAVRVTSPPVSPHRRVEQGEVEAAVAVVDKEGLAPVAPCRDVEDPARDLSSQRSWHRRRS